MELTEQLVWVIAGVATPFITQFVKLSGLGKQGGLAARWLALIVGLATASVLLIVSGQPLPALPEFVADDPLATISGLLNAFAAWLVFGGVVFKTATTIYDAIQERFPKLLPFKK